MPHSTATCNLRMGLIKLRIARQQRQLGVGVEEGSTAWPALARLHLDSSSHSICVASKELLHVARHRTHTRTQELQLEVVASQCGMQHQFAAGLVYLRRCSGQWHVAIDPCSSNFTLQLPKSIAASPILAHFSLQSSSSSFPFPALS